MPRFVEKTPLNAVASYSRLFVDFSQHPSEGLLPYLSGVSRSEDLWLGVIGRAEAASRDENGGTWSDVVDEIVSLSARLGTRGEVLDRVRAAERREAFFVVTGQQPGTLGGPLHTLYKVLTAVALAGILEDLTKRPFVPLYWCGGDDTDFQEIRRLSLVTRESTPISTMIPQQAHGAGLATGDIGIEWLGQVWKNVRPFVEEFENGAFAVQIVDGAFERARDHGEHASAILVGLTGGALAVVDGRSPAVRRHAQPMIVDYVTHEDEIKRVVIDQGEALQRSGYHAQLTAGADSGIFLLENDVRKTVTPELRPMLVDAARHAVERCSPGVIARNLVQDFAIKPAAVVLGPAEIAYRCQINALYPRFGVPSPVPVPRLTATFVPPGLAAILQGTDLSTVEMMLRDPSEFVRSICERSLPPALRDAADELERQVREAVDRFSRAIDSGAPPKAAGRIKPKLSDLNSRAALSAASVSDIGRAIAYDRWVFLSDLASLVRPGGKPQERTLSGLVPCLFGGPTTCQDLLAIGSTYLDDLLDGRTSHIVYSSTS
jgi:uncharacterized protein YllA (UPF0747 family)